MGATLLTVNGKQVTTFDELNAILADGLTDGQAAKTNTLTWVFSPDSKAQTRPDAAAALVNAEHLGAATTVLKRTRMAQPQPSEIHEGGRHPHEILLARAPEEENTATVHMAKAVHMEETAMAPTDEPRTTDPPEREAPLTLEEKAEIEMALQRTIALQRTKRLTRRTLQEQVDWPLWKAAEFRMLDEYKEQNMYDEPILRAQAPKGALILSSLWAYVVKPDGRRKARNVCNGQPRRRQGTKESISIGDTYAASMSLTELRVFWSIVAMKNWIALGADATNAFAYADGPEGEVYMRCDEPYVEWWNAQHPNHPITTDHVMRVRHGLQGHPESPRLWEKHINRVLTDVQVVNSPHAPCLYFGKYNDQECMVLRQVDDFSTAALQMETAKDLYEELGRHCKLVVEDGPMKIMYGVDIEQTRDYIKLHSGTYLTKLMEDYPFLQNLTPRPTEFTTATAEALNQHNDPDAQAQQSQLETRFGFKPRSLFGKILFPVVCTRYDGTFGCSKLGQNLDNPDEHRYRAIVELAQFLCSRPRRGLIYWRTEPREDLPRVPLEEVAMPLMDIPKDAGPFADGDRTTLERPLQLFTDSDHAADVTHRRSYTGVGVTFRGTAVFYQTRLQPSVTLSSGESELVAKTTGAKAALHVKEIYRTAGCPQDYPIPTWCDNEAALKVTAATGTTKRLRHVDIQYFALQQWREEKRIAPGRIHTSLNPSDSLTKSVTAELSKRHNHRAMGYHRPPWAPQEIKVIRTLYGTDISPAIWLQKITDNERHDNDYEYHRHT